MIGLRFLHGWWKSGRTTSTSPHGCWRFALAAAVTVIGFPLSRHVAIAASPPNIVIILSDDQRPEEIQGMPNVQAALVGQGVTFTNALISNPLCCPSRAAILTGMYSHSNGVYTNGNGSGGWSVFKARDENRTTATALHDAGYRTGLVGKYLNGYSKGNAAHIPPGWDRWFALLGGTGSNWYYRYWVSDQGIATYFGGNPTDYSTDILAQEAVQFIMDTPPAQPLFLYLSPFAPHEPSIPPTRYSGRAAPTTLEALPSFNETDVSDKPAYIRNLPMEDPVAMDSLWNKHVGASLGVDDAVGSVVEALRATGRLNNTLLMYLADQGVALGEHRWKNKEVPYESVIRTPLVVRWDALGSPPKADASLVGNVDLAPTIAAATGASMPWTDGKNFLPLMGGVAQWRQWFLLEHGTTVGKGHAIVPGYCGARTPTFMYVEYVTGERELYDLALDPFELDNAVADPAYAPVIGSLHALVAKQCPAPPRFGSNAEDT